MNAGLRKGPQTWVTMVTPIQILHRYHRSFVWVAKRTSPPWYDERLSVDDLKEISADFAAIYEHCEQASSERLWTLSSFLVCCVACCVVRGSCSCYLLVTV